MAEMLTPDKIMEIGVKIRQRVLETSTPEEKLAGLDAQERLAGLDAQEILSGMTSAERRQLLRLLQEEADESAEDEANSDGDTA